MSKELGISLAFVAELSSCRRGALSRGFFSSFHTRDTSFYVQVLTLVIVHRRNYATFPGRIQIENVRDAPDRM